MKRGRTILAVLLVSLAFSGVFGVRADTADELLASLKSVFAGSTEEALAASDTLTQLFSAKTVTDYLIRLLAACFAKNGGPVTVMAAIVLLAAVIGIFAPPDAARLPNVICLCAMTSSVFSLVVPLLDVIETYLRTLSAFITGVSASFSLLDAASGYMSTAAVTKSAGAAVTAICETVSVGVVLPCVRVILALSALGILSDGVNVSGITSFLRSFCLWGLGILFALFGCVHAVLVKVASGADEYLLRSARVSASRLIPVAGGLVADCLESVLGAMKQIRTGAGGLGIAYLVFTLLPPLASVLAVKAVLLFVGFFAKTLGQNRLVSLLDGIGSALNLLLALVLFAFAGGTVIAAAMLG